VANRTKLTVQKKKKLIKKIVELGTITAAAEACGVARQTIYDARKKDEEFDAQIEDALNQVAEKLEAEAVRRAYDGSDTLLIFLLKGAMPHKYKDRVQQELTGKDGGPVQFVIKKPEGLE